MKRSAMPRSERAEAVRRELDFEISMTYMRDNTGAVLRAAQLEGRTVKVTECGWPIAVIQPVGVPRA